MRDIYRMDGIRTISCKLDRASHQALFIDATLEAFAGACNYVAEYGRTHQMSRQYELHKHCYQAVRQQFGLSANLAVRAIARVAPRLRKARTRHSTFKPTSADYDARIFRFYESDWTVGLTLLSGRQRIALRLGDWQRRALTGQQPTSAILTKKRGAYYIDIQVKEPLPALYTPTGPLGVDLGLTHIATLSDGTAFGRATLKAYRQQRQHTRQSLQSKADTGSKSTRKNARRALKRLSGKERRYQQWINHQISKHVVETAHARQQAVVLEDLEGIRQRANVRKAQRRQHHSWAFYQLRQFIAYKAQRACVPVVLVNPAYTSQTCSTCLHVGPRRASLFSCANCSAVLDADVNGARNIAALGGLVTGPENSTPLACSLHAAVGGG